MIQLHLDTMGLLRGRPIGDIGYRVHAALAGLFAGAAPKPFTVVDPPDGRPLPHTTILGYARDSGEALCDHAAAFADPDTLALLVNHRVTSKPVPTFAAGRRLGFEVLVCPTVRRRRNWPGRDEGTGAEQDAFLRALDLPPGATPPQEAESRREEVYRDWLQSAFERLGGVGEMTATMTLARRAILFRRGHPDAAGDRRPRSVDLPEARFIGDLTVTDPAAFSAALARGVGRHRAFGFGMLLLRPPSA